MTPFDVYYIVWTDAAINRDTNNLVPAALELFREPTGADKTLLLRAVFFVAVVEGGAVPGEDGDAEVVLDRERADYEDEREPRDVADVDALDADERQEEV